jgi:hypothetical protein
MAFPLKEYICFLVDQSEPDDMQGLQKQLQCLQNEIRK